MQSSLVISGSGSATSRALACPDIIVGVVEQTTLPLDDALYPEHDCPMLSSLALVCWEFNRPATKALWSRLESFSPLLSILSAFDNKVVWPDTSPTHMISGDIPPHEFSRFRKLASFVRSVIPFATSPCVCELEPAHPDVWLYLSQLSGSTPLLPHLQELHWAVREPSGAELLFIISSSLRRLFICHGLQSSDSQEWMLSQGMLFRTIFNIAPYLTHLVISDSCEALFSACLSNIHALRTLRVVTLDPGGLADSNVLRALSSVESLEELSIEIGHIDHVDFCGFSALRKLDIAIPSHSSPVSCSMFDAFSSPHLRKLTFRNWNLSDLFDTDDLSAISTTIARRFPSLVALMLVFPFSVRGGVFEPFETALAPLFPLPLSSFSLALSSSQIPLEATFTDNFFAALAKSWPHLLELSIVDASQKGDNEPLCSITAQTLFSLAHGCPQLQTLRLPSMKSPRPGELDECPVLQHPLRNLNVDFLATDSLPGEGMEEDEHLTFALLLDKLFPNINTSATSLPDHWRYTLSDAWNSVLYGVRFCQLGRNNRTS